MPVFITDPDALDRMTQVEGEPWRLQQAGSAVGFDAFLKEYLPIRDAFARATPEEQFTLRDRGVKGPYGEAAIHGEAGWNRYFVRWTGEIVFSDHHCALPKWHDRARAAGFRLSSDGP